MSALQKNDLDDQTEVDQNGVFTRKNAARFGVVAAAAGSQAANAAVDVSNVVTEISGMVTPVAAIGGAMMLVLVAIKAWKMIRRAM